MGLLNDWRKRRRDDEQGMGFEYYEDTHNEYGEYVGSMYDAARSTERPSHSYERPEDRPFKLPDQNQYVSPRNYQNVVVYTPTSPEDVQTLIDFLKRREPAIVNLDETGQEFSQRILDFISGAMYALSGSVHRVAGNIFLLSPEGVEITVPYERKVQD